MKRTRFSFDGSWSAGAGDNKLNAAKVNIVSLGLQLTGGPVMSLPCHSLYYFGLGKGVRQLR